MAPLVILLGFMGSGKTAAGRAAAALLDYAFVDLDAEVAASAGKAVDAIFADEGEQAFRSAEVSALRRLLAGGVEAQRGTVLALGGGAPTQEEIQGLLVGRGLKIWLQVDPATAWGRVAGSGRPLARDRDEFLRLAGARQSCYLRLADVALDTAAEEERAVAQRIARLAQDATGAQSAGGQTWRLSLQGQVSTSLVTGGQSSRHECLAERGRAVEAAGRRLWVVTDDNLAAHWPGMVRELTGMEGGLPDIGPLVVPPGESAKSLAVAERGWRWLAEGRARRDDVILAFGGGVVGDLAGFLAATYLRGLELWQVPTSLLAQVDSSVGGKVAVNLEQGKNLVGAFHQPARVFIDPLFLLTLNRREVTNGLGEVIKYAVLSGEGLLGRLESAAADIAELQPAVVDEMVRECVAYKAGVVGRDERESGERAVLNLGHTTAHALERVLGYGEIGHGTAVALGVLVALRVSEELLGCPSLLRPRLAGLMRAWGLPVRMRLPDAGSIVGAMKWDKKSKAGGLGFVGVADIGRPVTGVPVPEQVLLAAMEEIRE